MRKLSIIIGLLLISSIVVLAQKEKKDSDEMAFDTTTHDFGQISYASDATHEFKFRNNSKEPIVLTNVKSSCGCTVPTWSREPIQPGHSSTITVKYNTNIPGSFNKTIQVFSNAKNSPVRLIIRGSVEAKEKSNDTNAAGAEQKKIHSQTKQEGTTTFPLTKGERLKQSGKEIENPVKKKRK